MNLFTTSHAVQLGCLKCLFYFLLPTSSIILHSLFKDLGKSLVCATPALSSQQFSKQLSSHREVSREVWSCVAPSGTAPGWASICSSLSGDGSQGPLQECPTEFLMEGQERHLRAFFWPQELISWHLKHINSNIF